MILSSIQSVAIPEVIIDGIASDGGVGITDPDTARRVERILQELRIEKETGIVGQELARTRLKRKHRQLREICEKIHNLSDDKYRLFKDICQHLREADNTSKLSSEVRTYEP